MNNQDVECLLQGGESPNGADGFAALRAEMGFIL